MDKPSPLSDEPTAHYDRVTEAWGYLLGPNLHYGYFDDGHHNLDHATSELTRQLADIAPLVPGIDVLDVGCGSGYVACFLAANYGCRVVGISLSEVGLNKAIALARARNLTEQVAFELRDGMNNGFPDESFDCAWVMESSHLMPNVDALISECSRVLRQRGTFRLCDIVVSREISQQDVLRNARTFDLLRRVYGRAHMKTVGYYMEAMHKNGLRYCVSRDITGQTMQTFELWKNNAELFRDQIVDLVGEDYRRDFIASCDALEGLWRNGTLGYAILSAVK